MAKTTSLNLRISPEFRAQIEELAAYHGLTMSSYAHSLLVKCIRQELLNHVENGHDLPSMEITLHREKQKHAKRK